MILLGNILIGVSTILGLICQFAIFILMAKVIMSWVNADPYNPIVRFIDSTTEPVLGYIRAKLRLTIGRLDYTPLILLVLIMFFQAVVVASLADYGYSFKGIVVR